MSKIIDTLKARRKKTGGEFIPQQIGDIYFSATGKTKAPEGPAVTRVVRKMQPARFVPWIISSIAFIVAALSLFSTKKVLIDIKVIDRKNPYTVSAQKTEKGESGTASERSPDTSAHKIPLKGVTFEGAASLKSSNDKSGLTLINSSIASFARATLHLDPPLDLSDPHAKIVFYAKGSRGGEHLAFAMKDGENIQGFIKGKVYPFSNGLTTAWQKAAIDLRGAPEEFDAKNVTSMHFEFGSRDSGNKPGDMLFIKDLQWVS